MASGTMLTGKAGGDIFPCRFVKPSAEYTIVQAAAGTDKEVFGVSAEGQKETPVPGATKEHATAGDPVSYHPVGEDCLIEAGAATTTSLLMSDAQGRGIDATATNFIMAVSDERAAAAGEKLRCRPQAPRPFSP